MEPSRFESLLERYQSGEASAAELAELESILRAQPSKRRQLVDRCTLEGMLYAVHARTAPRRPEPAIARRWWLEGAAIGAVAAALLLTLGLGLYFLLGDSAKTSPHSESRQASLKTDERRTEPDRETALQPTATEPKQTEATMSSEPKATVPMLEPKQTVAEKTTETGSVPPDTGRNPPPDTKMTAIKTPMPDTGTKTVKDTKTTEAKRDLILKAGYVKKIELDKGRLKISPNPKGKGKGLEQTYELALGVQVFVRGVPRRLSDLVEGTYVELRLEPQYGRVIRIDAK